LRNMREDANNNQIHLNTILIYLIHHDNNRIHVHIAPMEANRKLLEAK